MRHSNESTSPVTRFDVIIVGGGVAGLATAVALRTLGYSVAVIERGNYDRPRIGESFPPEIKIPLAELTLWESFLALRCAPAPSRLSAWGDERLDEADYVFNAYGNGWLVLRPTFERMMAAGAVDCGVTLFRKARIQSCARDARSWRFTLLHDERIHALGSSFAVVATGRGSSALRGADETRTSYDRLLAIVAAVARPVGWPSYDHRPLVEATADGWWFSALFPDGRVHVAMMTDADLARNEMRRHGSRPSMLSASLAGAPSTRARLGHRLELLGPAQVVAANTYASDMLVDHGKLVVGDVASAVDPLAGQGSFAALAGGIRAAGAIDGYFRQGMEALQHYADDERRRFAQMLADRTAYYRMERRWPESCFWRRRQVDVGGAVSHRAPAKHSAELTI
jgi:flavin-dependent dehydrogenase